MIPRGTSLAVQWLRRFHCRGHGFNRWSEGAKILHATWCSQKKKRKDDSKGSDLRKEEVFTVCDGTAVGGAGQKFDLGRGKFELLRVGISS